MYILFLMNAHYSYKFEKLFDDNDEELYLKMILLRKNHKHNDIIRHGIYYYIKRVSMWILSDSGAIRYFKYYKKSGFVI